jgi:hypothetical protein
VKKLVILLALTTPAHATDKQRECFRRIAFTEAGGESLHDFAVNVKAIQNLAKAEGKTYCGLIRARVVKANRRPPEAVRPYVDAVIAAALRTKADISNGANSWNRGKKPAYRGRVKRQTKRQVFYTKNDYNSN